MEILHGLTGLLQLPPQAVVSIGNFDGMHRGHTRILQVAGELKRQSGKPLAVVTFEPHPLTVLRPELAPPRLTPPVIKKALIESMGVDQLVILAPTTDVLNLAAEDFWGMLRDQVRPSYLVEGQSFTFGKGRGGTIERLREWATGSNCSLTVVEPVTIPLLDLHIVPVSSSLIRWLLPLGRVRDAAICLGRPYHLEGTVIKGHQRGRTIGIPTANIEIIDQLVPGDGVYAGRCELEGINYLAAVSIGTLPTFGEYTRQVEAHLIGYSGDLYGRRLRIGLMDWIREQRKFAGVQSLKEQIFRDMEAVQAREQIEPDRPIGTVTV